MGVVFNNRIWALGRPTEAGRVPDLPVSDEAGVLLGIGQEKVRKGIGCLIVAFGGC